MQKSSGCSLGCSSGDSCLSDTQHLAWLNKANNHIVIGQPVKYLLLLRERSLWQGKTLLGLFLCLCALCFAKLSVLFLWTAGDIQ